MSARLSAVLASAACAAGLAACGGTKHPAQARLAPPIHALCIYAGAPTTAASAARTAALTRGIRLGLAAVGNRAGQFTLSLCGETSVATPKPGEEAQIAAQSAAGAAAHLNTILYVGEVTKAAARVSSAILADAGVPQLSPAPTTPLPSDEGYTLLQLVPAPFVWASATRVASKVPRCQRVVTTPAHTPGTCLLVAPTNYAADGELAVQLLVAAIKGLGANGSDRAAVLSALRGQRVSGTVLGQVSFDGYGYLAGYTFDLYRLGLGPRQLIEPIQVR